MRSRYRRSLCLPTSCLSVLHMRHALEWEIGEAWCLRGKVFGWVDFVQASWTGPIMFEVTCKKSRPVPSPVLPASAPPSASFSPPPFLPQHNTMHSTLSTTAVSGTPLSCTAAPRNPHLQSVQRKLSIWILGITSPIRLACHSSSPP